MAKQVVDPVSSKTSEEALDFVRRMQKAFPKTPSTKAELAALRKYLARFTDAELRAVGHRVLSDLVQRPSRTIHEGDLPPTSIAPPEPHGATPPTSGPKVGTKIKKGTKPKAGPVSKRSAAAAKSRSARRRAGRS